MLCLVKETPVVRQRHPDIHGCRCNIVEVPRHPNTWYQVQVHNAPVSPKHSKYNAPIKVQAPSLIPISEDGTPILGDAAEELASAPKSKQDSASSKSKSKAGKSRDSPVDSTPASDGTGLVETYPNISGQRRKYQNGKGTEAGVFLSKTEPTTHWIGRRVLVKVGKTSDTEEALVVGSGKGWVQLVYAFPNGSPEGPAGEHPKDCVKRAHELKCKDAAPHAFDDPMFNGGKFAATGENKGEVTITSGRFKKRKGKVIGGGHGYYLVELRDRTTLLKTEDQLEAAVLPDLSRGKQGKGGVAPAAEDNGSAGEANGAVALVVDSEGGASAAENGGAGGGAGGSAASSSSSSSSSTSGKRDRGSKKRSTKSSDKAAAKVSDAVPNAAAGRPRRANAGVNKSRHSMPGTTSNKYSRRYGTAPDGGDEDSDGEHTRTGPMTPAEKLAHRNKEKIKAKFRAVQNAVLKRSKRSTRGSRYSQVSSAGLTGQGATTKSPLPLSLFPPFFI